jgi:hypothetical protein
VKIRWFVTRASEQPMECRLLRRTGVPVSELGPLR